MTNLSTAKYGFFAKHKNFTEISYKYLDFTNKKGIKNLKQYDEQCIDKKCFNLANIFSDMQEAFIAQL